MTHSLLSRSVISLIALAPLALVSTAFIAAPASAAVVITVVPSVAPVLGYSPSSNTYASNAMYALRNGLSNYGGDQSVTPAAYAALGASANVGSILESINWPEYPLSGFNSWMGQLNPTGAFANEHGSVILFGVTMVASVGTQIQLDHIVLNVTRDSSPSLPVPADANYNLIGNYTANRIGVLRGADGILGTGDDIVVNSGNANQFVDALYLVGGGVGWVVDSQAEMTEIMNTFGSASGSMNLTGTWKLLDDAGVGNVLESASSTVALVPAPSAVALIGLVGAFMGRRRRN